MSVLAEALPVALLSAAVFGGLAIMADRRRGTVLAQGVLVLGAVLMFLAIAAGEILGGIPPQRIAAFGVGLMAASVAGMLYHLYVGRFAQVRVARGLFLVVYLVVFGLFGRVFLSLI